MQCKIDDLPDELLEYILSLVPPYKDLEACKFVCKRWRRTTEVVIARNEAHFQRSMADGSLLWSSFPSARIGNRHSHSACIYDNSMYVFGGCTSAWTTFNDLWKLDLDTRTWERPNTMGSYPSPKACATMLYYKKSFILFGGWSYPVPYPLLQRWRLFNELHIYSIESNKWTAVNTLVTPPPTSAHSATIHGNIMVVFGGVCDGESSNDVWCFNLDLHRWYKQITLGNFVLPEPRYGQSQIKLGEKHLLILGGCTGPNTAMNDAWLLEMEGSLWMWKKVNILNTEWAPTRIWCHQACKVGNYVIVLSKDKRQARSNDMSISIKKTPCQRSTSPRGESSTLHGRPGNLSVPDRDENINGRHGAFSRSSYLQNARTSSHLPNISKAIPLFGDNSLGMAAFREQPPILALNSIRLRQLESLRRMEEKIKNKKAQAKAASKKSENTLSIFVLDITKVLDDCSASWISLKQDNYSGPEERILYSLVAGKGELIVFGGISRKQFTAMSYNFPNDEVYNDLHFISPPRYNI